jgi:uncharacterized small protein (DUF1192 family)
MQLTPYKELINLSPEDRDKKNAATKINKQKKKGELKIAELDERISALEDKVTSLCSVNELDYDKIVDAQDELALAQRRKEQFQTVVNQLFPEA